MVSNWIDDDFFSQLISVTHTRTDIPFDAREQLCLMGGKKCFGPITDYFFFVAVDRSGF